MKLKIKEGSVDANELKVAVKKHFEGTYTVTDRGKDMIAIAASKTSGAIVLVRKKSIILNGNFPTLAGHMVFMILLILLGIIIPLIIYFLVFHKKMKAVEKDVAAFIKEHYTHEIIK